MDTYKCYQEESESEGERESAPHLQATQRVEQLELRKTRNGKFIQEFNAVLYFCAIFNEKRREKEGTSALVRNVAVLSLSGGARFEWTNGREALREREM